MVVKVFRTIHERVRQILSRKHLETQETRGRYTNKGKERQHRDGLRSLTLRKEGRRREVVAELRAESRPEGAPGRTPEPASHNPQ